MSEHFEIDFIGHACLKITVDKLRILTDPWIQGPAYTRQWYQYPLPDRSTPIDDVHYVHYSHGHEDHLHQPSFALLPKSATVLLTRQWFPGNCEWLRSEGFHSVRETPSGHWSRLSDPSGADSVQSINLVNRSDSLSVMLTATETLVNANDALHCYDDRCIDHYCRRIQSLLKGRRIDYLFCGFGGASFFPNCLRHPRKNDRDVAIARERHFAQGFVRVARNLEPRMAFAFAAGLVLLEPFNEWINEIKFSNNPVALAEQQLPSMRGRICQLVPGDRIVCGRLERKRAHLTPEEHVREYRRFYADEIQLKQNRPIIPQDAAADLLRKIASNFQQRLRRIPAGALSFDWAIRLLDRPEAILRLTRDSGALKTAMLPAERLESVRDMLVEANSEVLRAGIDSLWGGDSLQIGYGGLFHLRSDVSINENHSRQFLRLATRLPMQSDYLRLSPMRGLDHLFRSPFLMREAVRIAVSKVHRGSLDSSAGRADIMDASRWIEAPKCAGCPVCDVPAPF